MSTKTLIAIVTIFVLLMMLAGVAYACFGPSDNAVGAMLVTCLAGIPTLCVLVACHHEVR